MNWNDWYTDRMDVFRNEKVKEGNLTRMERKQVLSGIACRVYSTSSKGPSMTQTAASVVKTDKLACGVEVDLRAGDELIVHRGAVLGYKIPDARYFAGDPERYYEPFGAAMPGLAHQEIPLLMQERVK